MGKKGVWGAEGIWLERFVLLFGQRKGGFLTAA